MSSSSLIGKLALVTGGSGTIGKAIARGLVQHGAIVVLTGRNADRLELAAQGIQQAVPNSSVKCITCDVSLESSVQELFRKIDNMGNIDLLVNNAGINAPGATENLSGSDFHRVLEVNVLGPFLCAREAMKRMRKSGGGRIINIGSLSAEVPRPDSAPYTTSKFALNGLTQSLALDGREDRISVGIIHPGNVKSELLTEDMIAAREHEGFLLPENVAHCVVTMASLPDFANVLEMTVLPTKQPFVGRG